MMAVITAIGWLTRATEAQQLHSLTVYPHDARPAVQTLIPVHWVYYSYTYDYRYLLTTGPSLVGIGVLDVQNKHAERYPLLTHLPHPPGVDDWQDFVWNSRRYVVSVGGSEVRVWDITDPVNHTVTAARISPGADSSQSYFERAQQVGVVINDSGCYIMVGGLRPSVLLVLRFDGNSLSLVGGATPSGKGLGVTRIASRPPNFDMIAVGTYSGVIELYTIDSSGSLTPVGIGQLATNQGAITRLSFVPNVAPAVVAMDETPRIYLWDIRNKYPLAMREVLINLTKFQPWIGDRGNEFLIPRFQFAPNGSFFALRWAGGATAEEYGTLLWFEVISSNSQATSLRVAGTLNGSTVSDEKWVYSGLPSFTVGPRNEAWIGWGMQPLSYANAPWEVSLRLPNSAGVGTAIACSPSGALIGTSQGHLYYYDAEAIGAESYTPMQTSGINGVVHSAVYLGTQGDDQYFLISYGDGQLDIIRINPVSGGIFRHASVVSLPGWGALRLHARSEANGAIIAVGGSASGTLSVWRWQTTNPTELTEATTESTRWFTGRVISDVAWNPNNNQIGLALRRAEWGRATFTGNGFSNQTVQAGSRNGAGVAWDGNTLRVVYSLNAPSGWAGYQILYVPDTFRPSHQNRLIIDGANYALFTYTYPLGGIFGTFSNSWRMVSSVGRPTPVVRLAHGVVYRDYPYAVATTSQGHVAFFLTPPLGLRGDYLAHQLYYRPHGSALNSLSINRSTRQIAVTHYLNYTGQASTIICEPDSMNPLGYRITKRIRGAYMLHPVPMVINGVPEILLHSWLPRNQLTVAKLDVNADTGILQIQTISGRGFMSTSWNGNYLVSTREVSNQIDFQVHVWSAEQGQFVNRGNPFGSYFVPLGRGSQCYVSDDGNWAAVFYFNYNVNPSRYDLDIYQFDQIQNQWVLVRSEPNIVPPYVLFALYDSSVIPPLVPVYPIIPGTNRLLVLGSTSLDEYDMAAGNRTTTPLQRTNLFGFGTSDNGDLLFYHLVDQYYLFPRSNRLLRVYRYDGVNWNLIRTFDRETRSDETIESNYFPILRPIGGSGFVVVPSFINGIVVADSP